MFFLCKVNPNREFSHIFLRSLSSPWGRARKRKKGKTKRPHNFVRALAIKLVTGKSVFKITDIRALRRIEREVANGRHQ